ncbi:carboxypeptidase regulatory-like domain-containing protein [Paracidobacterium acidisoli]|nr:carboxypeptidase regulatory-like domain-containing protein [Paracidobacterium acidisoli]
MTAAVAQVQSGRVVGTIYDPNKAVIPAAAITVTNTSTNVTQKAVSGSQGDYVVTPVNPGTYNISVKANGFETMVRTGIEIQVGQIAREDFNMQIGASSSTVEVTGAPPLLNTDTATVGQVVTNTQIVNLPLNGRGFFQLAQLTPGAALLPATGNSVPIRPESIDGNTISGIRGSALSFLLDGVDISEQHQGGTFIQTSIDALQEFSVQQNPYSAEFNRGGGFFNATTKSGTNHIHGDLFEFLRNDALDARNFFALNREPLKRNQFGGTLGGPLSIPHLYSGKNRTFFFGSYEGQRLRQGLVENSVVPTAAQRNGDFSAPGLNKIFDPTTTTSGTNPTRAQFEYNGTPNIIPPDELSTQAQFLNKYIPLPNTNSGTFSYNPTQSIDLDQFTLRFDDQINASNRLFLRWSFDNNRESDPNSSPLLGTAPLHSQGEDIAVGLTTNIGTNMVSEVRAHYLFSRIRLNAFLQGQDINNEAGVAGFEDTLRPGTGGSFPDYSWSGYGGISGSAFDQRPKGQNRKVWEPTWNLTIIRGKNTIKFGALVRYYQWLGYDSEQYVGVWTMSGINTQNPASPTGTGDAFADWMLGYPANVQRAYPANFFGGQNAYYQFFGQDDFRLSSRLTLNLGLRYEYTPWLSPYKNQMGTFDPSQAKPIIVSGHGDTVDLTSQYAAPVAYQHFGQYIQTSHQAGIPYNITATDRTQFAPRIGFSWQPLGDNTVFRGGYGIFYEPENGNRDNYNILPYKLAETAFNTANAVPNRTLADFFLGAPLGTSTTQPTIASSPVHLKMGYDQHWSFDVQQQLTKTMVADIGYVGNHGVHLQGSQDLNDPPAGPGAVASRRPYPIFGGITLFSSEIGTTYNSLQAKIDERLHNGLTFLAAYTWSKFMQSNPSPALGGNNGYEKSIAQFNIPQNFAFSMSYELPFGKNKQFMNHPGRLMDAALGGWQVQNITVLRSGLPFTPIISRDVANTGVGSQRPIQIGSGKAQHPTLSKWFNQSAFEVPAQYTYGTSKAFILEGDMYRQYDVSVFKSFQITEGTNMQFRAEFFNLPNVTSFNPPSFSANSTAAPSATIDTASGAKILSTSTNPRQIQFALKYYF